jgi:hypothetical protein
MNFEMKVATFDCPFSGRRFRALKKLLETATVVDVSLMGVMQESGASVGG